LSVKDDGFAKRAGIKPYDVLIPRGALGKHESLEMLSDPASRSIDVSVTPTGPPVKIALAPVPKYLQVGREFSAKFPTNPVWAIAMSFACIAGISILGNTAKFFQEYLSDKSAMSAVSDI